MLAIKALAIVIGLSVGSAEDKIACNDASEQKLDQLALELSLFGDPKAKHPVNPKELSLMCSKDRERLKWIRSYMDECLVGSITYDVMALACKDLDNYLKKYCDSPKLSNLLLSWSECGNKAKNDTMQCFNNYVLDLERIASKNKEIVDTDKIPLICCNYFRFDRCAEDSFEKPGPQLCPSQSVEGLHSMFTEVLSASIDFLCGEFKPDNDKCDPVNERYKHLSDVKIDSPRKTPVLPFIQIISNYPKILTARNSTAAVEEAEGQAI